MIPMVMVGGRYQQRLALIAGSRLLNGIDISGNCYQSIIHISGGWYDRQAQG
jgi:hypothetical protein